MPLVTEGPDADSYVSVADADSYHGAHGNGAWQVLEAQSKEAALRYATQYVDGRYQWRGRIASAEQALGWPRLGARDDEGRELTGIPGKLTAAVCELALAHVSASLSEPQGPRVVSERVEGAIEVQYADATGNEGQRYPLVDAMLSGLVRGGGNAIRGRRA